MASKSKKNPSTSQNAPPLLMLTDELLRKPRRKRCGRQIPLSPFPIPIETITRRKASDGVWYYYFGLLKSDHVAVYRKGDLSFLYQMGFFGKGMLSKSQPQFEKMNSLLADHAQKQRRGVLVATLGEQRTFLQERLRQHAQWAENMLHQKDGQDDTKDLNDAEHSLQDTSVFSEFPDEIYGTDGEDSEDDDDDNDNENQGEEKDATDGGAETQVEEERYETGDKRKLINSQDDTVIAKKLDKHEDPYAIFEYLQLTFEEAFFLSYGLGCFSLEKENGTSADLAEMWNMFLCRKDDFVATYTAYHHFRSKGWVVRFSNLFGADFVLYQDGMPFYHASYSVFVKFVAEKAIKSPLSWKEISCICRVNEKVAKEVLLCYVIKPADVTMEEMKSPQVLKKLKVIEMVIRRWQPEKHREIPREAK